jgi:hypothetical protein
MLVLIGKERYEEALDSEEDVSERLELLDVHDELGGYPSQVRPVLEHFWHAGFALSHLIRRILRLCQLRGHTWG